MQEFVVGRADEFPPGSRHILEVGGRSIGIYHSGGRLFAVQNVCPHALAPICERDLSGTFLPTPIGEDPEYALDGLVLKCVWHGWEWDVRSGTSLFTGEKRRLKVFPIRVEKGDVVVTLRPLSESKLSVVR
jgi:nitrite reductase (NADH) small subunit